MHHRIHRSINKNNSLLKKRMYRVVNACSKRATSLLIDVENSDEVLSKAIVHGYPTFRDEKPLFPTGFRIEFFRGVDNKSSAFGLSVEYSYYDLQCNVLGSNTVKITLLGKPPEGRCISESSLIRNDDCVPDFSSTGEHYINVPVDEDAANEKIITEIIRISDYLSSLIIDE